MINVLPEVGYASAVIALYLIVSWQPYRPQHSGAGEGALTVWHLIAHVEAERRQRERGGRHRLREPVQRSTSDAFEPPPQELQRRVLEGLRRL
ncbi:hypothetical protein AB0H34_37180 [Saccharopolyspora shandongensis]|uniref:hypothetical protein n=1 Tax=Saccharopolyspora shandongensis TaxID=418495 RepID=UPI0033E624FC